MCITQPTTHLIPMSNVASPSFRMLCIIKDVPSPHESFVDFLVKTNLQGWIGPCELSYGKPSCGPTYLVLLRGLPMSRVFGLVERYTHMQ